MELLTKLRQRRLLAIVRAGDARSAIACIEVLADEGVDLIEVSLTSHDALAVITEVRLNLGDVVELGAGTVMTRQQAQDALDAGATYLVTPSVSAGADEGVRLGVPVLMGALTPTEVASAVERGATAVKLFPAELGGPRYLAALRAPYPEVPFVPVGGVDVAAAHAFLVAGAVAVGVGSPLLGDAADGGDLDCLRARAADFRSAVPRLSGKLA
jgi:2-dehydro-3-deoxyphosphogluconate aldolase/(4S)-4-hydroxy-2-oxoglutarate aldolase